MAVHVRQLQFVLKVRHRPQATHQDIGILVSGEMRHQLAEAQYFHIVQMRGDLRRQRHTLIQAEQRLFARAGGDGQNDVIEH